MKAEDILSLKARAEDEIKAAKSVAELEAARIKYLGRNGLLQEIREAPPAPSGATGIHSVTVNI